ncbi:hypothetical protein MNBD_NITROSPINAE04-454 [hydrothermal vent metagenome]|uniref:Outer membrane protein beta-barrel domain-containing protein n=1 Tax=hydrothermal vent metagenome TaxID=652676 RepID=A0A3B1C8B4_9ZZZZ
MRKLAFSLLFYVTVLFLISPMATAEEKWIGDVNIRLGQKNLTPDHWKPVADQPMIGMDIDFGKESWPAHILLTLSGSARQASEKSSVITGPDIEGSTSEFGFGVKTHYLYEGFNPFLTLGLSWTNASLTGNPDTTGQVTDKDNYRMGIFLSGGVTYKIMEKFNVGGEIRLLRNSEVTLFGETGDADYISYSLILGWGF